MLGYFRSTGSRAVLTLSLLSLVGARPQCDVRTAGTPCTAPTIVVEPGTCVEIDDPCAGDWSGVASLSFAPSVEGVWCEVKRRPTGTTVSVCAADTVALTLGDAATLRIVDTAGRIHTVSTEVATVTPLAAYVTAVPETVTALDTLELTAHPSGGVPPYTYQWLVPCSTGDPIGDNTTQTIRAYASCDKFWLGMKDAFGGSLFVETIVPTYVGLTVTATPDTIDPGGTSKLEVQAKGGEMVRTYYWSPTTGLSTPNLYQTNAKPAVTTRYTFYVVSDHDLQSSASATVVVRQ